MNRAAKVMVGVSAVIVAGLVAVAIAPFVMGPAEPSAASSTASTPTHAPTPKGDDASVDTAAAGAPAGYVDIGRGMSIPAGGPGDCEASAWIYLGKEDDGTSVAEMLGADIVDMGAAEFATGEVHLDDQGRPATYTVAAGDVPSAIGDRFCIVNGGGGLEMLNGYPGGDAIQPGDVLTLNADLVTDWVSP